MKPALAPRQLHSIVRLAKGCGEVQVRSLVSGKQGEATLSPGASHRSQVPSPCCRGGTGEGAAPARGMDDGESSAPARVDEGGSRAATLVHACDVLQVGTER
jgi:hypothetical protein